MNRKCGPDLTENTYVAVAMPAFKEAAALELYASELKQELIGLKVSFHLVDDASPDNTGEVATLSGFQVTRNLANMGHGPSYLNALSSAVESGADFILMTDGDGQLSGEDAARLIHFGLENKTDIVWGVRRQRAEALHRKATSLFARLISFAFFGVWSKDANTPHRLFSKRAAKIYLERIPRGSKVPNILGTIVMKKSTFLHQAEFSVGFRDRLGAEKAGVTWGKSGFFPSKRFTLFVIRAFFEVLSFRRADR